MEAPLLRVTWLTGGTGCVSERGRISMELRSDHMFDICVDVNTLFAPESCHFSGRHRELNDVRLMGRSVS